MWYHVYNQSSLINPILWILLNLYSTDATPWLRRLSISSVDQQSWQNFRSQAAWDATLVDLACETCISPDFWTAQVFKIEVDSQKVAYDTRLVSHLCTNFHFSTLWILIDSIYFHLLQDFVDFSVDVRSAARHCQVGSWVALPQHILSSWKKRPTVYSGAVRMWFMAVDLGEAMARSYGSIRSQQLIAGSRNNMEYLWNNKSKCSDCNHFVMDLEFSGSPFLVFFSPRVHPVKIMGGSLCLSVAW